MRGGGGGRGGLGEILVVIVFGHEIHIFIPKFGQNSHFFPKCTEGMGGGPTGLGNVPKKTILACFPYL